MVVMLLTALASLAAVMVAGVLVDNGLRWWSAFGTLRRELKAEATPLLPSLRPALTTGGCAGFDRAATARPAGAQVSRAA